MYKLANLADDLVKQLFNSDVCRRFCQSTDLEYGCQVGRNAVGLYHVRREGESKGGREREKERERIQGECQVCMYEWQTSPPVSPDWIENLLFLSSVTVGGQQAVQTGGSLGRGEKGRGRNEGRREREGH